MRVKLLYEWILYVAEDFFEQSLVMKAFIGWGWLCVIIMLSSLVLG